MRIKIFNCHGVEKITYRSGLKVKEINALFEIINNFIPPKKGYLIYT